MRLGDASGANEALKDQTEIEAAIEPVLELGEVACAYLTKLKA